MDIDSKEKIIAKQDLIKIKVTIKLYYTNLKINNNLPVDFYYCDINKDLIFCEMFILQNDESYF